MSLLYVRDGSIADKLPFKRPEVLCLREFKGSWLGAGSCLVELKVF